MGVLVGFIQVSRRSAGEAILSVAPDRLMQPLDWIGSRRAGMTSFPKRSAKTAHLLRQFSRIAGYFLDHASIGGDVRVLAGKRPALARFQEQNAHGTWSVVAGLRAFHASHESSGAQYQSGFLCQQHAFDPRRVDATGDKVGIPEDPAVK